MTSIWHNTVFFQRYRKPEDRKWTKKNDNSLEREIKEDREKAKQDKKKQTVWCFPKRTDEAEQTLNYHTYTNKQDKQAGDRTQNFYRKFFFFDI